MKIRSGRFMAIYTNGDLTLYWGQLSVSLFHPSVERVAGGFSAAAQTCVLYSAPHNWQWWRAAQLQVLGFGVAVAWNHVDAPGYKPLPVAVVNAGAFVPEDKQ